MHPPRICQGGDQASVASYVSSVDNSIERIIAFVEREACLIAVPPRPSLETRRAVSPPGPREGKVPSASTITISVFWALRINFSSHMNFS